MAKFFAENLDWLKKLETTKQLLQENPNLSGVELADKLGGSPAHASYHSSMSECLDQVAIDKIQQAALANPPFIFSFNNAKTLARFNNKVPDLTTAVHAALDLALSRRLVPLQTQALVEWIIAGKPAAEFDPQTKPSKPPKSVKPKSAQTPSPAKVDEKLAQLIKQFEEATGQDKVAAQERVMAYAASQAEANAEAPSKSTPNKKSKKGTGNPNLLLEWAAGINPFSQVKSKIKKGQPLTLGDWILLGLENFGKGLHWLVKHPLKWIHEGFKFILKIIIDTLKTLGIYNFVKAVLTLALLALLVWAVLDMRQHGFWHPINLVRYRFFSRADAETSSPQNTGTLPTEVPTKTIVTTSTDKNENKKHTQPSPNSGTSPAGISHPSVIAFVEGSDAQETKPYLDQELHGISNNSVITAVAVQPDSAMGSDMAYRRLTDLQDKKYSVRWGNDQVSVVTINPTASNLILKVQSGLDSLLGGPSKADFYWEEVKGLHCDEIKTTPIGKPTQKTYQISLFLAESKKTITIQCATPADLEHLVSALEYYIKLSRGNTAPITGLPYLNQGVRLDNDGKVMTLWANSPIAKAGLVLSDYVWSLEKNTDHQQRKTELEAGLRTLTPGSHILYKVTADGWNKAWADRDKDDPDSFRPLRRKVTLTIL